MLLYELLVRGNSLLRLTWVNILSKALLGGEEVDNRVLGGNGHPAAVVIVLQTKGIDDVYWVFYVLCSFPCVFS
jgi:hypothetical protein